MSTITVLWTDESRVTFSDAVLTFPEDGAGLVTVAGARHWLPLCNIYQITEHDLDNLANTEE